MATGLGQRIKQKRKELGLSQEELANRLGLKSKSTICKIERGDDNLTTSSIRQYADALNCTPSYLMGWENPEQKLVNAYLQGNFRNSITETELEIIKRYRVSSPEAQSIIKKILGMETEVPTLKKDIG